MKNNLREAFRENEIIMVELIDAPETRAFIEMCRTASTLRKRELSSKCAEQQKDC